MRILAVRGRNLASLAGDFELTLDTGPLATTGLFAIAGHTGAGKSTLLDAMCLALYDSTPRLDGRGGATIGRDGQDNALKENDVRNLVSRGTAEALAEVDFVGVDERRYRASWTVKTAYGKVGRRFQGQEMSLADLDSGELYGSKKTSVLEAIRDRVGLSFDQFRRSVLLAQGDFAAFLKAGGDARAELLERMTGTEIYTRLSQAAYDRLRDEIRQLHALELEVEKLGVMSSEKRESLDAEHAEAEAALPALKTAAEAADEVVRWWSRKAELEAAIRDGERSVVTAQRQRDQANQRRTHIQDVRAAQPLRPVVLARDESESSRDSAREALTRAKAALVLAEEAHSAAKTVLDETRSARNTLRDEREALQPELQRAEVLDARLVDLRATLTSAQKASTTANDGARKLRDAARKQQSVVQRLREQRTQAQSWMQHNPGADALAGAWSVVEPALHVLAGAQRDIADATRALPRQREGAARASEVAAASETRLVELQTQLPQVQDTFEQALAAIPPDARAALAARRSELEPRRIAVDKAREAVRSASEADRQRQDAQASRAKADADSKAAEGRLAAISEATKTRAVQLEEAARARDIANRARGLDDLRAELVDGEPCALCGSPHHPWAHGDARPPVLAELDARVQELEAEQQAAEAQREASVQARADAASDDRLAAAQLEAAADALARARTRWIEARVALPALPDNPLAARAGSAADEASSAVDAEANALVAEEQQLDIRERAARDAREAIDALRELIDRARAEHDQAGEAARTAAAELEAAERRVAEPRQRRDSALDTLEQALGGREAWRPAAEADATTLSARLRAEVAAFGVHQATLKSVDQQLSAAEPEAAGLEAEARAAELAASEADQLRARHAEAVDAAQRERDTLLGGRAAAEVRRDLSERERRAEEAYEKADAAEEQALGLRSTREGQREAAGTALGEASTRLERAEEALGAALAEHGLDLKTVRARLQHDHAWIDAQLAELTRLDAAVDKAEAVLGERRAQLEAHREAGEPDVDAQTASAELAKATSAHEAAQKRVAALEEQQRLDDDARAKAAEKQVEIDAQLAVRRTWGQLVDVIGSSDGKKFRNYAQGLTLDALLRYANRHLQDLAPRYRLQRVPGADLALQVIDTDMADEIRPVTSLSGGETFLTSLSLALALASLSSAETPIDSLFIDEGFGTLDRETLDIALSALQALQATGRQVGIISHVDGLADSIGMVVRVERAGAGRSRLVLPEG